MRRAFVNIAAVATLVTSLSVFYRASTLTYLEVLQLSSYSYLMVLIPTSVYVVLNLVNEYGTLKGLDVFKFAVITAVVCLSALLYVLSRHVLNYALQLELLSLATLTASVISVMYGEFKNPAVPLAVWLLLISFIPLPYEVMESLASSLASLTASLTALIVGGKAVTSEGFVGVAFVDFQGVERVFQLTPEYSGLTTFLTIYSLTPITLYHLLKGVLASRVKKVKAYVTSIALAAVITFLGSLAKAVLITYLIKVGNYQTASSISQLIHPLTYVALAAITSLYVVFKLPRKGGGDRGVNGLSLSLEDLSKVGSLAFVTLLFFGLTGFLGVAVGQAATYSVSVTELFSGSAAFNASLKGLAVDTMPKPFVGFALNALTTYEVEVVEGGYRALGYVEVAEAPSRFHEWRASLTTQGCRVLKQWVEVGEVVKNYALIVGNAGEYLLAYSVYTYVSKAGNAYVRISLVTEVLGDEYVDKVSWLSSVLSNVNLKTHQLKDVEYVVQALNVSVAVALIASVSGVVFKVLRARG
ncbi:MAG: hypothetical protein B7O98_00065 [Zestosphaera tikiterensis]|uniref:Uncharacterized protein n=1 Tax=Zestosphaera tikiterensis TaxID=1973259 RepID=A0A2R7Y8J1_9CREN|nr:MAG: hypothetical protein B7O98_00065 [Zestosphaera tikiterensis]